jgi:hypothetical protein
LGLHIGQDRLKDDLLDTAAEALAINGATEREQALLKRDVAEALCLDMQESLSTAARRILRQHRKAAA